MIDTIQKYKFHIVSTAVFAVLYTTFIFLRRKRKNPASFNLDIKITTTEDACNEAVNELRLQSSKLKSLGFDCEWVTVNGKRKPVALIQLSSYDGHSVLFRLCTMKYVPNSLKDLLEDEKIYKVGVAPGDDGKYLLHDYGVNIRSTLDLRHLSNQCGYDECGLASLSKSLLGVELDKSWRVRCSDWEAEELSPRQILYAAADAYVSIKMFKSLLNKLDKGGAELSAKQEDLCIRFADLPYRKSFKPNNDVHKVKETKVIDELTLSKRYPNALRSKPLYHNCFLQAPDGELLCTCDNKKALWYVEKNLGELIQEDPMTVRLLFEPSGRSVGEVGRYYQLTKQNLCVVCGTTHSYIRKNVVPREYRKYFPEIMKDHSSHDVVLLCASCHQLGNGRDRVVRERLAKQCDAPLSCQGTSRYIEDITAKKIRSAARALLYQSRKHVLPEARRQELEELLLQHYANHDRVTRELLEEASVANVVIENLDYESHGLKVVEYYLKHGGLLKLEELWREHFLSTMRPNHMPELWSLKHNEERLKVRWREGRLTESELLSIGVKKWDGKNIAR